MSEQQYEHEILREEYEMKMAENLNLDSVNVDIKTKDVWGELSHVDVSEHVETKGTGSYQLKYLSWAWAWGELMKRFPDSSYEFEPPLFFDDGSCEIWVTVSINGTSRKMWLPVMDHKNNAIIKPNSRQISDTRMRRLVKCLAMFGLGHYIYAGEDLPEPEPASGDIVDEIDKLVLLTGTNKVSNPSTHGAFMTPMNESVIKQIGTDVCGDFCKAQDLMREIITELG